MSLTEYLNKYSTRFALAHLCNDYHSGQRSRGYKALCKFQRHFTKVTGRKSGLLNYTVAQRNKAVFVYDTVSENKRLIASL